MAIAKPARKWPTPAPISAAYAAIVLWLSRRKSWIRVPHRSAFSQLSLIGSGPFRR